MGIITGFNIKVIHRSQFLLAPISIRIQMKSRILWPIWQIKYFRSEEVRVPFSQVRQVGKI